MAAEPVQLPTSGSLAGILDVLETDEDFRAPVSYTHLTLPTTERV